MFLCRWTGAYSVFLHDDQLPGGQLLLHAHLGPEDGLGAVWPQRGRKHLLKGGDCLPTESKTVLLPLAKCCVVVKYFVVQSISWGYFWSLLQVLGSQETGERRLVRAISGSMVATVYICGQWVWKLWRHMFTSLWLGTLSGHLGEFSSINPLEPTLWEYVSMEFSGAVIHI